MKKSDKIVVLIGVAILIIASIGIYFWSPEETKTIVPSITELSQVCGVFSSRVDSVTVSNNNPFYPLIATPLTVNYDSKGEQYIAPLYVINFDEPSSAVVKAKDAIGLPSNELIIQSGSSKDISLEVAQKYWESSKAVILVKDDQAGYNLGVLATPLASYLSAPVIVTNETDSKVMNVLSDLGVEYSLVCGDIEGYKSTYKFVNAEDVVNLSAHIVEEKFGEVDYITLTNPVDAWPPKVLDSVEFNFADTVQKGVKATWKFTIPADYKYALVKFTGVNHNLEDVDSLGYGVMFDGNVKLPDETSVSNTYELTGGGTAWGGNAERDDSGKIISDSKYEEVVLYDRGGAEYDISVSGRAIFQEPTKVTGNFVVEKLENPVYPMMKGLSSMAPYLTAYHKGIIFGKPEFAFTADDDVLTDKGETCPGAYVGSRNWKLIPLSNRHFFDEIHDPLNKLLSELSDIPINDARDIEKLTEYYKIYPMYIALVGDATVLPNYFYQNHVEPVGDINGDGIDDSKGYYFGGGGTPSDVLYGNVDPIPYEWSNLANDVYSEYPYVENIVGRITGWDAQDVSALIARTVFYNNIINKMGGDWKDNFGLLVGGGQDFQKPLVRYNLFRILGQVGEEPLKIWTGYGEMTFRRTAYDVEKTLEFTVLKAYAEEAMSKGYSDDVFNQIKNMNLKNKLLFPKAYAKSLAGESNVKGTEIMESSNFIFANGHGCQYMFGMSGTDLPAAGLGGPLMRALVKNILVPVIGGGNWGPGVGGNLAVIGEYSTREVSSMNLGPSFMWLESCFCGRLDGVYPRASVSQALLHAGVTSLISSPTGSNIGGGYLEGKKGTYDLPGQALLHYLKSKRQWKNGNYEEPHFGFKIYSDLSENLGKNDVSIGLAFRNARNNYLPSDIDWKVWWSPPLVMGGGSVSDFYSSAASSGAGPMKEAKYVSYQEYLLFGDPAFIPYIPNE
jgi:hypothetical protein